MTGFTLLELLAVLFVMALVATFVVPSLGNGAAIELKSAARVLAAGLRHTRNQALTANRPAVLAVDVLKHEFQLPSEERVRRLPDRIDIALFAARSEQQDEYRGAIRFFPDGSSTGGRVTLSAGGRTYLVDVDWLTGRVDVIEAATDQAKRR